MKFKMNDREWIIKEVEQNELCSAHNDFSGDGCYYGITFPSIQEIWLYKDIKKETKKKTLYHELMHCYLFTYVSFNNIDFYFRQDDDYKEKSLMYVFDFEGRIKNTSILVIVCYYYYF